MDPDPGHSAGTLTFDGLAKTAGQSSLEIEIVALSPDWLDLSGLDARIRPVAVSAFQRAKTDVRGVNQLTIALSNDEQVRKLNKAYLGKNKPTNVLSFPYGSGGPQADTKAIPLGDIILGFETIMQEAAEGNIKPIDHICHLVAHGVLHLLGFDHEDEADAEKMESLESEILVSLGIPDPYCQS